MGPIHRQDYRELEAAKRTAFCSAMVLLKLMYSKI